MRTGAEDQCRRTGGRGIGVIDGWNVRITITDYGQDARLMSPRA
ncbi:hypothetical protein ACVWZ7_001608 [Arthrobacter sp. TE12232]